MTIYSLSNPAPYDYRRVAREAAEHARSCRAKADAELALADAHYKAGDVALGDPHFREARALIGAAQATEHCGRSVDVARPWLGSLGAGCWPADMGV